MGKRIIKSIKRKVLASLLAMIMVLSMLPLTVLTVSAADWNGSTSPITSGNGTAASPYLIENAEQLAYVAQMVKQSDSAYQSACYKLTQNITLNSTLSASSKQWTPIGVAGHSFQGTFDGNGKTISGLYRNDTNDSGYYGLFGLVYGATIKNIRLSNSSVTFYNNTGLIAGAATDSTIFGCIVYPGCSVTVPASTNPEIATGYSGGILGSAAGTVTVNGCQFYGSISGELSIGGIVGFVNVGADVTIESCTATEYATVKGNLHVGGIVGHSYGKLTIEQCRNYAAVSGMANVGGIIGRAAGNAEGKIVSCTNMGKITGCNAYQIPGSEGKEYRNDGFNLGYAHFPFWELIGGIAGRTTTALYSCSNYGVIEGESKVSNIAGIAGYGELIVDCTNDGSDGSVAAVTGFNKVAGIAANAGKIIGCTNSAKVTIQGSGVGGGIAEYADYIAYCKNSGEVKVDYNKTQAVDPGRITLFAGGITAELYAGGKIIGCYNSGNVYGVEATGGIIGLMLDGQSVENCVSAATVTDANYAAGGIVGQNEDKSGGIRSCYSVSTVSGKLCSGGIVGVNYLGASAPANNFYNGDITMTGTITAGGTSKTAAEMRSASFPAELGDFYAYVSGDYPRQKSELLPPSSNEGTPYRIYKTRQLTDWSNLARDNSAYRQLNVLLMEDTYLYAYMWTPIQNYSGTMDGNGKTIYGLTDENGGVNRGLFASLSSGTVADLTLADATVKGSSNVGAICGKLSGTAKIQNCRVIDSTIIASGSGAGGIVGSADGTTAGQSGISACYSNATVSAGQRTGGIAGYNDCPVTNCYSTANVSGTTAGGVVGYASAAVTNCYYAGSTVSGAPICAEVKTQSLHKNNYYLSDTETDSFAFTTAKTAEQFAAGEVCYLLNNSTSDGTLVWGQIIDKAGATPQAAPVFSSDTVYNIDTGYSNTNSSNCVESADATKTNVDMPNRYIITSLTNNKSLDGIFNTLGGFTATASYSFGTNTSPLFGTGSVISFNNADGVKKAEYTLVVKGDIDGDSICDVLDCFKAEQAVNNNVALTATETLASDYDSDGSISAADYQNLVNTALS